MSDSKPAKSFLADHTSESTDLGTGSKKGREQPIKLDEVGAGGVARRNIPEGLLNSRFAQR